MQDRRLVELRAEGEEMSDSRVALRRETAAAVLIDTAGRLLLQLRDDVPEILYQPW